MMYCVTNYFFIILRPDRDAAWFSNYFYGLYENLSTFHIIEKSSLNT